VPLATWSSCSLYPIPARPPAYADIIASILIRRSIIIPVDEELMLLNEETLFLVMLLQPSVSPLFDGRTDNLPFYFISMP